MYSSIEWLKAEYNPYKACLEGGAFLSQFHTESAPLFGTFMVADLLITESDVSSIS